MSPRGVKKSGAAFLATITLLLPFYPVLAAQVIPEIQPPNKPFGGKITKIQACQSPPGLILHIGPPSNGQYFLSPSSKIHTYGVIMPGVWTLGLAEPSALSCKGNPGGIGGFDSSDILDIASQFDPTGTLSIISLVFRIFNFIFGKKPPTLGPAYSIIRIGTGPAPSPQPF